MKYFIILSIIRIFSFGLLSVAGMAGWMLAVELTDWLRYRHIGKENRDMKKITYCMKRLATEYKVMYKPDGRTLMLDTIRIAGTAAVPQWY